MPTPIAIAIVEHEGRFLIGQRPDGVALAGLWEFPGGKIEPGESPEAAAVRECEEEAGIVVTPLFRYPEQIFQYEHAEVQLIFIAAEQVSDTAIAPRHPFRWVIREELPNYQFPDGNRSILELLAIADTSSRG